MSWGQIGVELHLQRSTVQSAHKQWCTEGVFKKTMGRRRSICQIESFKIYCKIVAYLSETMHKCREKIRRLRHQQVYHFYDSIPMPPLNDDVNELERMEAKKFHSILTGDESWFMLEYQHAVKWSLSREDVSERVR
jgi:hypothetical protein